jgi:hypothetical protein
MQYLLAHIPRTSPLHARLTGNLSEGATIFDELLDGQRIHAIPD